MTVKVSQEEYELLQQARDALRMKGLDDARISVSEVEQFDWRNLALGAIVGIGAYVLLRELLGEE
jgi:hypothetical protein